MRRFSLGRWFGHVEQPISVLTAPPAGTEPETAEAQFELGRQSAEGAGQLQDYFRATAYYLKAAERGHTGAQFNLGLMFGQGKGLVRDETASMFWLRKAALRGHAGAQYHVGVKLHRASKSVRPPEAAECRIEAFKWTQLALGQGYRGADAACEFVALGMTQTEVDEAMRRAGLFAPDHANPTASVG